MIPVYVNVFNRLTMTRNLCDQIANLNDAEVVIIDNNSDWQPLLDWYAGDCPYEVIRLAENLGHHAPWLCGAVGKDPSDFYAVTDCDLDLIGVPLDLLSVLRQPLVSCIRGICGVKKSGMSLRIDDLPEWQKGVVNWERQFWKRPVANGRYYVAPIDTTFCMYRKTTPQSVATRVVGVRSVRSAQPYCARHLPWYLDCENLSEEDRNYFATAGPSNSWKPSGKALASRFA